MVKFNKFASIAGGVAVGNKRGHVVTKVRKAQKKPFFSSLMMMKK
jgi:hypothetical protein